MCGAGSTGRNVIEEMLKTSVPVIAIDKSEAELREISDLYQKAEFTFLVGDATAIARQYNIGSLPMTILIDRRGRIAETHVGMVDKAAFEKDLLQLLREK